MIRASFVCLLLLSRPSYAPLRLQELEQLKLFYNATGGADWRKTANWDAEATSQCGFVDQSIPPGWPYVAPENQLPDSGKCIYKDPCGWDSKWYGVGCVDPCYAPTDGDNCVFGRVTYLNLKDNSLAGTIPETFFDELINITALDLSYNSISGTIPTEAGKLRNLRSLELSNNALTGTLPTEIAHLGTALGYGLSYGGLEGLTHFDVSHNNLTGIIPSEVAYLENLKVFDVSNNANLGSLEGGNLDLNPGLPSEIGMLTHLHQLKLDHCGFSGTLPIELGALTKLQHFLARGTTHGLQDVTNRFSGTLPTEIGKLKDTVVFAVNDNRISGTIPPEIGGMSMLTRAEMQENDLSGTMPDVFAGLGRLKHWDSYGNYLTGDLPPSIQNVSAILEHLYIQTEQTDALRNFRCRERIPGLGSQRVDLKIPSSQAGLKINWYMQVAEYFNYKYASACSEPYDADFAFNALSGDV